MDSLMFAHNEHNSGASGAEGAIYFTKKGDPDHFSDSDDDLSSNSGGGGGAPNGLDNEEDAYLPTVSATFDLVMKNKRNSSVLASGGFDQNPAQGMSLLSGETSELDRKPTRNALPEKALPTLIDPEQSFGSTATTAASTLHESPLSSPEQPPSMAASSRALVVSVVNEVESPEATDRSSSPELEPPHDRPTIASMSMVAANNNATTPSNLNLGDSDTRHVPLYDREKELGVLRDEYANMVARARRVGAFDSLRSRNNLASVLCVAGKAGTGKTALVRSFLQQEASKAASSSGNHKECYFLFGKFDWPTSSVTSALPARPNMTNASSQYISANGDETSEWNVNSPKLAQNTREEQLHKEPFAAFSMVLEHLLEQIEAQGPHVAFRVRTLMRTAVGASGISVLGELTPKFVTFLQQNQRPSATAANHGPPAPPSPDGAERPPNFVTTVNSGEASAEMKKDGGRVVRVENRVARLKYVLRQLFRALCDNRSPCVLILDDAQWADQESLELARHLHSDFENPFFMLILTWRTNDIHEEESCYTTMGSSVGIFANDLVRRVNLQNLSLEAVNLVVAEALQMPSSDVVELSKAVHNKTFGNPFFVRQFLRHLEKEDLLKWRPARHLWRWKDAEIAAVQTSYNFVELVKTRVRALPKACRVVLQIVACLGQAFEEDSACVVLEKLDTVEMFDIEINHADAMSCLDALVRDGYLERHGASSAAFSLRTTFAHDQIQEAAFQLTPKDSRPLLQLRVGERLLEIMEEQGSEFVSFAGVDLCSKGIAFLSAKERMGLALYNLLAGEKCMARASFDTALAHFEFGLSSLRVTDFLKGRLSLELSFGAMESAYCVDDFDKVRLHYDRITVSGSNSDDKIRAHCLLIRAMGSRGDTEEAMATGYRVLKSIGVKTIMEVSNKVSLFVHLAKTKMALRKHSEESLANLREMGGSKLRHAMCVVGAMLPFAYQQDPQLFMLLVLKSVRWSVKYGVSPQSPLVFAALGSFPGFQGMDMKLCTGLGQAALRLLDRFGNCDNAGMVSFVVHSQILHWTVEPTSVQTQLEMTYRSCMECGDELAASCSLAASFVMSYESGKKKLDDLELLGETYSRRIKEHGGESTVTVHNATWQAVLNLRGESFNTCELTGKALNQEEALLMAHGAHNDVVEFTILSRQLQLCFLMGEHEGAENIRQKSEAMMKSVASSPHLLSHVAYCALNCLSQCASSSPPAARKGSNYKIATRLLKKLVGWEKDQGCKFGGHLIKLVQAELARVEGKYSASEQAFQNAIWGAGRVGNQRDKGLAHELAGRFFLRDRQDEIWSAHHFDHAIQAYHTWGATVVVNRLLENYGDVVSKDPKHSDLSESLLSSHSHETNVV